MKRELPPDRLPFLRWEDSAGLGDAEVADLRVRFGDNLIAEHRSKSFGDIAGDTAADPMLWFLAATSVIFALVGQFTDALVLFFAIAPLVGMDFYLHRRTEASLKGLRSGLATEACAIREGRERRIPATELVVGDLVRVSASDAFPADGVVLRGERLQADESSLSGEAFPVAKQPLAALQSPAVLEDNWAFAGTRLLTGEALVRIVFTGQDTIYGEIVRAATAARRERTPLQQAVARLVRRLLVIAAAACLLLAAVRLAQGYGPVDAFLSAAVLAVAAIPEEFPVVLTFFLGLGVYRLARRRALVRHAVAVENIGRVSAICSDKTGTITVGRLTLHELRPLFGTTHERLLELGRMASRQETGDPLDQALLSTGPGVAKWKLLASFPFTEARRRETAIWACESKLVAVVKGAPETVLLLCEPDEAEVRRIHADVRAMSEAGQKVIACAFRPIDSPSPEPQRGFKFAGLIGIADPLRDEVREAVETARSAGIRLVMVTGDHPRTAAAIAREAGISAEPVVLTGDELQERLAQNERSFLANLDAVARAAPAQKVLLVEAMREGGRVTAVTGDGVNDVPALRAADVGIAMGLRGTQSAREVASIILLDDNFTTIIRAIAEGRELFRNLVRSFAFLLMVHVPLVTTAAVIPLLGYPLLYLPIHIVILELMIHPAAILGFQRTAGAGLGRSIGPGSGFFSGRQVSAIILTGTLIALGVGGLFIAAMERGETAEHARAMAIVALAGALIAVFAILSRLQATAPKVIAASGLVFTLAAANISAFGAILHLHALDDQDLALAVGVGVLTAMGGFLFDEDGNDERSDCDGSDGPGLTEDAGPKGGWSSKVLRSLRRKIYGESRP
jgi:Ca2+-transporting ATPase